MKLKQIHDLLVEIVDALSKKEASERNTNLPEESKEYTKGQLYEAQYLLENIERIIYEA